MQFEAGRRNFWAPLSRSVGEISDFRKSELTISFAMEVCGSTFVASVYPASSLS